MDTVLLPATNHERWTRTVVDTLVDIESPAETSVIVSYTFDEDEFKEIEGTQSSESEGRPLDEIAAQQAGVSETVATLEQYDIDATVRGVAATGDNGEGVLAAANRFDVDRIYMYRRKRTLSGIAIFGGALQYVLSNGDTPVVVIPANGY